MSNVHLVIVTYILFNLIWVGIFRSSEVKTKATVQKVTKATTKVAKLSSSVVNKGTKSNNKITNKCEIVKRKVENLSSNAMKVGTKRTRSKNKIDNSCGIARRKACVKKVTTLPSRVARLSSNTVEVSNEGTKSKNKIVNKYEISKRETTVEKVTKATSKLEKLCINVVKTSTMETRSKNKVFSVQGTKSKNKILNNYGISKREATVEKVTKATSKLEKLSNNVVKFSTMKTRSKNKGDAKREIAKRKVHNLSSNVVKVGTNGIRKKNKIDNKREIAKRKASVKKVTNLCIRVEKLHNNLVEVGSKGAKTKNKIDNNSEICVSDSGVNCKKTVSGTISEPGMNNRDLENAKPQPMKLRRNRKPKTCLCCKPEDTKRGHSEGKFEADRMESLNVDQGNGSVNAQAFPLLGTVSTELQNRFLIAEHAVKKEIPDREHFKVKEEMEGPNTNMTNVENTEDIKPFHSLANNQKPKISPRKACPMTLKLQVIDYYKSVKNFHKTARDFGVCRKNIQRWVKNEAVIREMARLYGNDKHRMFGGGRKVTSQRIEMELITWYYWHRENGLPLTQADLVAEAVALHKDHGNPAFVGSSGWATRFKARHSLNLLDTR